MSAPSPTDHASDTASPFMDVSWRKLALHTFWIALRLLLVGALAAQGSYFFYQGF